MKVKYDNRNFPVYVTEDETDELIFDILQLVSLSLSMKMKASEGNYIEMEDRKKKTEDICAKIKSNLIKLHA